jgi:glutamate dehydrogenase
MTSAVDTPHEVVERVVAVAHERLPPPETQLVAGFIRRYFDRVPPEDLENRQVDDLFGAALGHWRLGARRRPGVPNVRIVNPDVDTQGWHSSHTIVDVVTDDMPFLIDSVTMALTDHGVGIHLVVHPMLNVERDASGGISSITDGPATEAWIHVEIDRLTDAQRCSALEHDLHARLSQVRAAVEDWGAMRARAVSLAGELDTSTVVDHHEASVAAGLLRWMADDHFTFLGFREYELVRGGEGDLLRAIPGTGLGLLRDEQRPPRTLDLATRSPEVRERAREPRVLIVTRANSRSPIHRPEHLAYVSIKSFDGAGNVTGERRFLGLYTAPTYRASAMDVPFLAGKIRAVLDRSGLPHDSHDGRELWNILETFPRDELFQISVDELFEMALGILNLQERRQVRLFTRRDDYGRFMSCMVYVPRDRYSIDVVERMEGVLLAAYGGSAVEHDTRISESVLARVHFLIRLEPGSPERVDHHEVEHQLAIVSKGWVDNLRDALIEQYGEEQGLALFEAFEHAFPASYREAYAAKIAVHDVRRMLAVEPGTVGTALVHLVEAPDTDYRFKLYTPQPVALSDVLPLLENMGVRVTDERPFQVRATDRPEVWIYDFGVQCPAGTRMGELNVRDEFRGLFRDVWEGDTENDGLNRLVLAAGLSGRDVVVVRAYSRYLRQIGVRFSNRYIEDTLVRHPAIVRQLVDLFRVRFSPVYDGHRSLESAGVASEIAKDLDGVASLDEDRILRSFLDLVEATVRTNAFRRDERGALRAFVAFKLDPVKVPGLPLPRPAHELWVYSPRFEGVHLRGGDVARGGLRWSDRREDFRTEVLGLMKAQMVKNAVIVPVGAKGGFVVKRAPADPLALRAEVVSCYRDFISGMLDLTDNIVEGAVVPPPDVVRHDGDDPYLVVAADKGTATFSDLANSIAHEYGFWLGDAFASGGSVGYDHKAMGITARGAWESVRRHFLVLGKNVDTEPVTAVGIGDMSGDVFGNGMLLSHSLRLVAAFDHRHIFLDPDPDPAVSYAERRRLFELPASSWADYDRAKLSDGGGVFSRTAKSIVLTPAVRTRLDVEQTVMTPHELMSAILRAPVDLLWNGGIGTYVKASTESNAEVGDRANDGLRVNGADLRCRVVAEGGNLGFTQRGRVEFALKGGLVNTDAIDNSAGVDTSDHEVNIKIVLDAVVRAGDLTEKQRNELLEEMTDDVQRLVLADNYAQNVALAIARTQAPRMVDVHARYVRSLELEGLIDRELELLPGEKQFAERQGAGRGLTTPEFAVLLAYTKTTNVNEVLRSDLPEDPYLAAELVRYFPPVIGERFADVVAGHRLRREIIATAVVNEMVNFAGTSFDHRMTEETGASVPDITRCHVASRDIFGLRVHWATIEELDGVVAADIQLRLFLQLRRTVERGVLWLMRHRRPPLDIGATVSAFAPGVRVLDDVLPDLLGGVATDGMTGDIDTDVKAGVPLPLARRAGIWPVLHTTLDVIEVANARGRSYEDTAAAYWTLFERLDLAWVWGRIGRLPRTDRWQATARGAMRDDLLAQLRLLTDDVLRAGDVFTPPTELVDEWCERNRRPAERAGKIFNDIRSGGTFDLTTLSVALRQLQNLVLSSRPG